MAGEYAAAQYQAQRQDDWKKSLLGDPLQDTPGAGEWARQNGYELQSDGTYRKSLNIGGALQTTVLTAGELANKFKGQKYLQEASALPTSSPNYLQQIQQYMGPQTQALDQERQQLSQLGASAGARSGQYSNPYEQKLAELINNPNAIENSNAYKFRFNQGQQALERSAAARGMLNSGNTLAALAEYGQGAASQEYGNEYNRLNASAGQRNQYNLGLMGASNQELGLRQQGLQDRAGTYGQNAGIALKALTSADELYNERKRLALGAAQQGGILKSQPLSGSSTW
jgi:hypothetical protein